MQPALLGLVKFGELAVSLSLWWQETLNKERDYSSMASSRRRESKRVDSEKREG